MRWYITVTAVHEWQRIVGWPEDSDGPNFDDAAKQLSDLCDTARLLKTEPHREQWQAHAVVRGRRERIELSVSTAKRPEGELPQLVMVRLRGGGRHKGRWD